jgi:pyruvate-formate lyase-activating enzyme
MCVCGRQLVAVTVLLQLLIIAYGEIGLTCTFCHNDGTPVVVDNRRRPLGDFTTAGPSGRASIYAATNGAAFLPAAIPDNEEFGRALAALRDALGLTEVHLTGGEPTLHPAVARLTKIAVEAGLRVGMTSNGERGERVLPECAAAGLDRVNFSVFGTRPPNSPRSSTPATATPRWPNARSTR